MKKYLLEILMFSAYALFAAAWAAGSALTPDIQASFGESGLANASWGTTAITLAKIVGNLAAAIVLMRLGPRFAFSLAMLLIAAGGLGALAGDYMGFLLSRLAMGLGGALAIVYFNPVVMHYFNASERPVINGINAAAFNTGTLVALLSTAAITSWLGSWESVISFYGVMALALGVLWFFSAENFDLGKNAVGQEESYGFREGIRESFNWWLPLAYCGVLILYIATFALIPLLDNFAVESKKMAMILIIGGMIGTLAGIIVCKRYPLRLPVIRFGGFGLFVFAALMVLSSSPLVTYTMAALAGVCMFLPMTALVTLPQELPGMTPKRITVTFAMFWSISYAIASFLIPAAGAIADLAGNPALVAYIAVACSASLFVFSFLLPESGKKAEAQNLEADNATA